MKIEFQSIGTIHTPYLPSLPIPTQPIKDAPGEFWITLQPEFIDGLEKLLTYRYITVLYYMDQVKSEVQLKVRPSWAPEIEVGVFASRSPHRPNPLGFSIVELKGIEGNEILISGIDVYNGTPLLDIKPYINVLDVKPDANDGWYDSLPDKNHVIAHLLDLSHEHSPNSDHDHGHSHLHAHTPMHDHTHDHLLPSKISIRRTVKKGKIYSEETLKSD